MPTKSNSVDVSADVKVPRGSKLDAVKRAEFQSDVGHVDDWDTSTWSSWTVTVVRGHVAALCALEKSSASVFEIADVVRSALAFPVDYIAFQNRGAYNIVLDLCINNQTGQAEAIPIFEPTFDALEFGYCFDARSDKSKLSIPWAAAAVPELPTALHDLTEAVQYPRRTFEHCRMAVEAIRRHFDPPTIRRDSERHRKGEEAMCAALKVTRTSLKSLDAVAARSRHGELVISMSWEMRKRALELASELVARFIDHLGGAAHDGWKVLDVVVEDYEPPKGKARE